MGRIDQMMAGRNEELALALKIVKNGGVEALEKEIQYRSLISTKMTMQEEALRRQVWWLA